LFCSKWKETSFSYT